MKIKYRANLVVIQHPTGLLMQMTKEDAYKMCIDILSNIGKSDEEILQDIKEKEEEENHVSA